MIKYRNFVCYIVTVLVSLSYAQYGLSQTGARRPIVVELFTSQGCASCPPADVFLNELMADNQVLPLSFHVDYWNSYGWLDPFSHPQFTKRQSLYNATLSQLGNYTPQMVVDGKWEAIGSYRQHVLGLIEEAKSENASIPVTLSAEAGGIQIVIADNAISAPSNIWVVGYDSQRTTYINAGENRGKQLSSYNVVRYLEHVGSYTGTATVLHVKLHWPEPTDNIAVILQTDPIGAILGASTITLGMTHGTL